MMRLPLFGLLLSMTVAASSLALGGCAVLDDSSSEEESEGVGESQDEVREVIPGPVVKSTDAEA
jgi:hypothetical protein